MNMNSEMDVTAAIENQKQKPPKPPLNLVTITCELLAGAVGESLAWRQSCRLFIKRHDMENSENLPAWDCSRLFGLILLALSLLPLVSILPGALVTRQAPSGQLWLVVF